jgi:hypothetical protein
MEVAISHRCFSIWRPQRKSQGKARLIDLPEAYLPGLSDLDLAARPGGDMQTTTRVYGGPSVSIR